MKLTVNQISVSRMHASILEEITMHAASGQFVGIIGPNGSGKSTLLKTVYQVLQPDHGVIQLNDWDVDKLSTKQLFQQMAVVSQENASDFDFLVEEIVWMGRTPHKKMFQADTAEDREIVEQALERVGMRDFAERSFPSLSGGEKQRVIIARALAQQAKIVIMDEPTNHLDIRYQLQLLELVKSLDMTVVAALHDLNLAAAYCDQLYVLHNGKMVASGTPVDLLTPELLKDIFGVMSEVIVHPNTNKPHILFLAPT